MNSERLCQLLSDTVVNVFEETVFALMDRDVTSPPDDMAMVQSLIGFSGTYTGSLALSVEQTGVAQLASDFLGSEASAVGGQSQHDVVGELANIIAGRLLEAWQPEATNYDIAVPTVQLVDHGHSRLVSEPKVCCVDLRTDAGLRVCAAILMGVWP